MAISIKMPFVFLGRILLGVLLLLITPGGSQALLPVADLPRSSSYLDLARSAQGGTQAAASRLIGNVQTTSSSSSSSSSTLTSSSSENPPHARGGVDPTGGFHHAGEEAASRDAPSNPAIQFAARQSMFDYATIQVVDRMQETRAWRMGGAVTWDMVAWIYPTPGLIFSWTHTGSEYRSRCRSSITNCIPPL